MLCFSNLGTEKPMGVIWIYCAVIRGLFGYNGPQQWFYIGLTPLLVARRLSVNGLDKLELFWWKLLLVVLFKNGKKKSLVWGSNA